MRLEGSIMLIFSINHIFLLLVFYKSNIKCCSTCQNEWLRYFLEKYFATTSFLLGVPPSAVSSLLNTSHLVARMLMPVVRMLVPVVADSPLFLPVSVGWDSSIHGAYLPIMVMESLMFLLARSHLSAPRPIL